MIRSFIYDLLILRLTSHWYSEVFKRIPDGAVLLDVGIGTAGALIANADVVRSKDLHITGIDIDPDYIESAKREIRETRLADRVDVRLESVYDHHGGPYDVVYFSASFMLLPDPGQALRHCRSLLKPGGKIFFTQTIQLQPSRWMEFFKPMLKRFTSIDFGRVTYEEDFKGQIRQAGLELEEFTVMSRRGERASCLAVARVVRCGRSRSRVLRVTNAI